MFYFLFVSAGFLCPAVTYTEGHEKIHAENIKKFKRGICVFFFFSIAGSIWFLHRKLRILVLSNIECAFLQNGGM